MEKSSPLPLLHSSKAVGTNPSALSADDVSVFFSFLADDLKKLKQSLENGSISLQWSIEAMNLLKKMQTELLILLKKFKLPISSGTKEDWFDQYMQETKFLLVYCNSMNLAVQGINRYRMLVDLASQSLKTDDPSNTYDKKYVEFERLEKEYKKLLDAGTVRETVTIGDYGMGFEGSNKHEDSVGGVMLAAESTMIIVSLLVISSLVSPVPIEIGTAELTCKIAKLKPSMALLMAMVESFRARVPGDGSGPVLMEQEVVHGVLGDLKAQVVNGGVLDEERFQCGVELLRTKSAALKDGIEMFDSVVDEVFDVAMKGRNEMLGAFRDGMGAFRDGSP